mmetsp:Transcript_31667/g.62674  ORF Transcript_31667/g.62674 Transcript_31667/m.62674 type:complete len:86 (-) Transcript_31667:998-1255(-)
MDALRVDRAEIQMNRSNKLGLTCFDHACFPLAFSLVYLSVILYCSLSALISPTCRKEGGRGKNEGHTKKEKMETKQIPLFKQTHR